LAVPTTVIVENLRNAVHASYDELSAQVQADSALDAKLLGLLGFFAVAGSLLLTLPSGLHDGRGLLLAGAACGVFACIAGSLASSSPNVGPPPAEFYAKYGARAEPDYLAQLLGDLTETRLANHRGLELRRRALAFAVCAPAVLGVFYGLVSVT
jgi:hypothetical protein